MKLMTIAAIAALAATPALGDPVTREQARADFHQSRADAARAQIQKEDAQAEADVQQNNAASAQAAPAYVRTRAPIAAPELKPAASCQRLVLGFI